MCGIYGFISNDKNINESNEELIFEYPKQLKIEKRSVE